MLAKDLSNKIFSPPRHQDTKFNSNKHLLFVSWCLCGYSFLFIRDRHKSEWNGEVMRLKQRWLILFVFLLFIISLPVRLLADGTYYVGRDDGGIYFQTDQDGGWYIDILDLRYFKIGQKGTYFIIRLPRKLQLAKKCSKFDRIWQSPVLWWSQKI